MVAVLQDHFLHVFDRVILPGLVAHVLPAGDLGEDHQAQPVAGIQEVLALRIVGRPDHVAAEFLFQDAGIFFLKMRRRGVAHIRETLVAVQAAEE